MTKTETWKCDRCPAQGEGQPPMDVRVWGDIHRERQLCGECLLALFDWIDRKPERKPIRRRRIFRPKKTLTWVNA